MAKITDPIDENFKKRIEGIIRAGLEELKEEVLKPVFRLQAQHEYLCKLPDDTIYRIRVEKETERCYLILNFSNSDRIWSLKDRVKHDIIEDITPPTKQEDEQEAVYKKRFWTKIFS